jgi:hypothetical protein
MNGKSPKMSQEIYITNWATIITCIFIGVLLYVFKDLNSALACVAGALIGWFMGVLLSPYEDEKVLFSGYARTAAAFVTGYLVSKLDRIFELFMASKNVTEKPLILMDTVWRPFVFALSSLILALIYTFTCRHYGQRAAADAAADKAAAAKIANGQIAPTVTTTA